MLIPSERQGLRRNRRLEKELARYAMRGGATLLLAARTALRKETRRVSRT